LVHGDKQQKLSKQGNKTEVEAIILESGLGGSLTGRYFVAYKGLIRELSDR
jgi:hypothetical protein